jgi:putative Ca2+/H+ antiporter (TMEM165/GDT1 family)
MDWKIFATVFSTVFLAELGDKTQLATLLFATDDEHPKLVVFAAAAAALIATSALAVIAGKFIGEHVNPKYLSWTAGIGFVAIGIWTIVRG